MAFVAFRVNRRFGAEISRLRKIGDDVISSNAKKRMLHEAFFALFEILTILLEAYVILTQLAKVISGSSSIGTMLALRGFMQQILGPLAVFNVIFVDFRLDSLALRRYGEISKLPDDPGLIAGNAIHGFYRRIGTRRSEFRVWRYLDLPGFLI